jgi:triacylglycerol esterase/lipase EstA (alpha/beta hydrolase family)
MGGLISRYYLEVLEGWRDCRALVTFGTPYRGAVDAVNYLANGYKQLFVELTEV